MSTELDLNQFIPKEEAKPAQGTATWSSPSNIALVKYWGKHSVQLPSNPSISFTLDNCKTTTTLSWIPREFPTDNFFDVSFVFDGQPKPSFLPKIINFFTIAGSLGFFNFLDEFSFVIESSNSFPHSSGIASSASGMSALALCLCSMEQQVIGGLEGEAFIQKASLVARLGSGSACRSVYGGLAMWGEHDEFDGSTDELAVPFMGAHAVFESYQDTILIADAGVKEVSSTVGHNLMHNHPFAATRFDTARQNMSRIKSVLQAGDLSEFSKIVEQEALMLHAMMMTSDPYFLLFKPNTLHIIEKIWAFRQEHDCDLCITLDAGANVHLLYPEHDAILALQLIESQLLDYCQNRQYLCDKVGKGPCQPTTNI
jgi:diphosphomevalonate decarboxylase